MSDKSKPLSQLVERVATYLLTLTNGKSYWLYPVDASNGVVMEEIGETGVMRGRLIAGGNVDVEIDHIFNIEEKRYRVTVNNGQGRKSMDMSDREFDKAIERAKRDEDTGEVKHTFKKIRDRKTGEEFDF